MNFLQLWGTEQQTNVDAWFENLLRETTNLDERQACEAFEYLLYAGSPADVWYDDLHEETKWQWPSLVLAFTSVWPVSKKLLCVSGALHARRMERKEEQARARDEKALRDLEQEVEWATEWEDYLGWVCRAEKKEVAFRARCEAAWESEWKRLDEWERASREAYEDDERVRREYEDLEFAHDEESLAWRVEEERLEADWKDERATLDAGGRRMVEEMRAARIQRVDEILRAEAEEEDRRRQEATTRRTITHCVRQPLYTTPTTLKALPNTISYPPPPETIAADVIEPTAKKPPDGSGVESVTSDALRESAEMWSTEVEGEGIFRGRVMSANGLTSHSLHELSTNDDHLRELVILPPTKHPTLPSLVMPTIYSYPPSPIRERLSSHVESRTTVRSLTTNDRLAPTKHPTGSTPATSVNRTRLPPWVMRLLRLHHPDEFSIVRRLSHDGRPAPTKHRTTPVAAKGIVHPDPPSFGHRQTPLPCIANLSVVARPPAADDRPALTKHPTTQETASSVVALPNLPLTHEFTRPAPLVQPHMLGPTRLPCAMDSFLAGTLPWVVNRPPPVKHPTPEDDLPNDDTGVDPPTHALLHDIPAPVKHPTVAHILAVDDLVTPTAGTLTNPPRVLDGQMVCVVTIGFSGMNPFAEGRPAPVKHPTMRENVSSLAESPNS
ncbi:hypothetical protein BOTBODRAFT_178972 [Botryobasidium botryosum FD-172 SS1]|uniref:Uncharacterized protein n=1 Tax=Botryobasidium botryosum (strain FD-172 SS1) TaxID=930990 RepID=A0A067M3Z1_BOTB1|nr:hypothetical protein BOTBODRAFT_178972 [Botryobasidium botryosum FD-172 SS1]